MGAYQDLMARLGCTKYPERWEAWIEEAEAQAAQEIVWLKPETYTALEEKHHCFGDYLEVYRQGAVSCGESRDLRVFFLLLSRSLADKANRTEDAKALEFPAVGSIGQRMVQGLAICTQLEDMIGMLEKRGLPEDRVHYCACAAVGAVGSYRRTHHGEDGFDLLVWTIRYLDCQLHSTSLLGIELLGKFPNDAAVFKNDAGEMLVIAKPAETETGWTGFAYSAASTVTDEVVNVDKTVWHKVLEKGDDVMRLHIGQKKHLVPEKVDASLAEGLAFAKKYFPEMNIKAVVCGSWLLSDHLRDVLPEDSNIVKFSDRFFKFASSSKGDEVFNFVFHKPDMNFDLHDLPENTTLERNLKNYYLNGNRIYSMNGFFLV